MLQGSCPSRTTPDFVLERTKSGDVRKMPQFTHFTADIELHPKSWTQNQLL